MDEVFSSLPVETASADALELVERHLPQVVFLDFDLPDLDGRTVARRIRERPETPPLLVAVSGFGGERHFTRSREAGIDKDLVKPVKVDEVLEFLRGVSAASPASRPRRARCRGG